MTQDGATQHCTDLAEPVTARDHLQGPSDARALLVEYGDYECPDCLNAWPVVKELRDRLQNQLAIVFRHFPQSGIHPHASAAAQAAEAAASQGKFWEMHDLLFRNQQKLADLDLTHLALQLGLEIYRFQADYEGVGHVRRIQEDVDSGTRSGVRGTPTFFINGCRYSRKKDFASMLDAIQAALA